MLESCKWGIDSCSVTIDERPGKQYEDDEVEVCVDVRGTAGEVFIDRTCTCHGEDDIGGAIHEAFRSTVRKLEGCSSRSHDDSPSSSAPGRGIESEGIYFG